MSDGTGLAEKMLGLPGVRVLAVDECVGEVVITVESTKTKVWCGSHVERHVNPPEELSLN